MSSVTRPARAFVAKSRNNIVEANITPLCGDDPNGSIDNWRGVVAGENAAPDILHGPDPASAFAIRGSGVATCPYGAARLRGLIANSMDLALTLLQQTPSPGQVKEQLETL